MRKRRFEGLKVRLDRDSGEDPDVVREEWVGRLLSREELEEQDRLAGA